MSLRPALARAVAGLIAQSERTREIELDDMADALGILVSADEVERVLDALEQAGRRVVVRTSMAQPRELLRRVLLAARTLSAELERTPRVDELAAHTGETPQAVRRALLYARALVR